MYRKVFLANQLRQSFERRHDYKHALPCPAPLRSLLAKRCNSCVIYWHSGLGPFPLRLGPA
jgi:hypothetical protein